MAEHTPERMEKTLRDHLSAGREVYGLWLTGRAVGALVLDRAENELVCLYVHPEYHRLGVGKATVDFAVAALAQTREMKVTVLYDNVPALRLYEAFGFRDVRETHVLNAEKDTVEEVRVRPASGVQEIGGKS